MLRKGQVLKNPRTDEWVEFLDTAADTGGRYTRFKTSLRPRGGGFEVEHVHPVGDEAFEVVSGTLTCKLAGKLSRIGPGERIELPHDVAHAHWNVETEPCVVIQTVSPCLDFEPFFATLFGLGIDGRLDAKGTPPFLQVMVWIADLQNKTYLAAIPRGAQDVLATVLSPLARRLGYRPFYEKYGG